MVEKENFKIYKNVKDSIGLYWHYYGGFEALLKTPYLHFAIITSLCCFPLWTKTQAPFWYDFSFSALPNLLGFTLGGYAILLAFGNEKFLMILCANDENETSPFMNVNGAFVHFIVVQAFALFFSIIAISWELNNGFVAFVGFTAFLYSLLTGVAAAFSILRLGKWYDIFLAAEYKKKLEEEKKNKENAREQNV